jgi:hypothetical protein
MHPTTVGSLARSHQRDLDLEADHARLVAEARAAAPKPERTNLLVGGLAAARRLAASHVRVPRHAAR